MTILNAKIHLWLNPWVAPRPTCRQQFVYNQDILFDYPPLPCDILLLVLCYFQWEFLPQQSKFLVASIFGVDITFQLELFNCIWRPNLLTSLDFKSKSAINK